MRRILIVYRTDLIFVRQAKAPPPPPPPPPPPLNMILERLMTNIGIDKYPERLLAH